MSIVLARHPDGTDRGAAGKRSVDKAGFFAGHCLCPSRCATAWNRYVAPTRRFDCQGGHKTLDAIRLGYAAHSTARSKRTRRRMSALYRECAASGFERLRRS